MSEATDSWGIVATVKAPVEQVLAFVAHHLTLGPERIWIFLDDPADPAFEALQGIDRVLAVRCDKAHWKAALGRRPPEHQVRQTMNIRHVYRDAPLDWLLHIDVDEFLVADVPVREVLQRKERAMIRAEPWDALHDPGAPEDIFSSRWFHRAVRKGDPADIRKRLYGSHGALLPKGLVGHSAGKCFFRTGIEDFKPTIHTARFMGRGFPSVGFEPGLALLHFHAEDLERWALRLDFRLNQGAYRAYPEMQAFLLAASDAEIAEFYRTVQTATPEALAKQGAAGFLREEHLGLRAKVAKMLAVRG